MRDSLKRFAEYQEKVLKANDHKGGWEHMTIRSLLERVHGEAKELREAFEDVDIEAVKDECADVANFAMMIFDNLSNRSRG